MEAINEPTTQSPRQEYSTTASLVHSMPSQCFRVRLNFWLEMRNCEPMFWQLWICCSGCVQIPVEVYLYYNTGY